MKRIIILIIFFCTSSCGNPEPVIVFDLIPLIGKDIDFVKSKLGKPTREKFGPTNLKGEIYYTDWYDIDIYRLYIQYNDKTRDIRSFTITSEKSFYDMKDIHKLGNLVPNSKAYHIELDGFGGYSSVTVYPKK